MKKISAFLASLLLFTAIAMSFGPAKTVQAFPSSEIDYSEYDWYESAKAGTQIYFRMSLDYDLASTVDVTGWKAALCPPDSVSLADAAVTFDISNDDKYINDEYKFARVSLTATLPADIKEGNYTQLFFDAAGNPVGGSGTTSTYINKTLLYFDCALMNDDGYAYAYVYSENPAINASTYPTFYGADKKTPITSFDDYTTTVSEFGKTVHHYRLNILDKSQFAMSEEYLTYLYVKAGTPNVAISVSGNDAGAVNDGGIGLNTSDAEGFSYIYVRDLNAYVEKYDLDWEVKSPFDDGDPVEAEPEEDDEEQYKIDTPAVVGDKEVSVYVKEIKGANSSEEQHAINNLVYWVEHLSDAVGAMNQYAPSMKVSKVLAAGALDLAIEGGVDISKGAKITFTDANIAAQVKAGDKVVVLHVKHDGTIEYVPAVAGDGNITATFTSLSPIAWYKVEANGSSGAVSPKTGVSFWDYLKELFF